MLTFTITFHGPFHVGTGAAAAGLDTRVDPDDLLPSTSLKGVMRAAARHQLCLDQGLVAAVYGDAPADAAAPTPHLCAPSPWNWSSARFTDPSITRHARIRVNDDGRVERGFLMLGQQVWAERATFDVERLDAMDDQTMALHTLVLRASARAVTSVGGQRRRGSGWVSITDTLSPWTDADTAEIVQGQEAS